MYRLVSLIGLLIWIVILFTILMNLKDRNLFLKDVVVDFEINPSLWPYLMAFVVAVILTLLWNYFNVDRKINLDAAERIVAYGAILGLIVLFVFMILIEN